MIVVSDIIAGVRWAIVLSETGEELYRHPIDPAATDLPFDRPPRIEQGSLDDHPQQ